MRFALKMNFSKNIPGYLKKSSEKATKAQGRTARAKIERVPLDELKEAGHSMRGPCFLSVCKVRGVWWGQSSLMGTDPRGLACWVALGTPSVHHNWIRHTQVITTALVHFKTAHLEPRQHPGQFPA